MSVSPPSPDPETPADSGTVPIRSKLAFGLGGFAEHNMNNTVNMMANPVLNVTLGVNPALVGTLLAIPRIWDAFTDPLMGAISDRFESRFGRRKPFILVGGLLSALFFALMWQIPRGMGEMGYFAFFLTASLLFYTCFTVFGVPYLALGAEMSPSYEDRTVIQTYRAIFGFISGFSINWLFWLTQRDMFSDTLEGMQWVAGGTSLIIVGCVLLTVWLCKERNVATTKAATISVFESFKETMTCRPFLLVVGVIVCVLCGILLVMQMALYINIYYIFDGDKKAASTLFGTVGTVFNLGTLIAMPLICGVANRFGKRKVLIGILVLAALGSLSKWFFYTPDNPWLQLIPAMLTAPGLGAVWALAFSMIADVCDYDEFVYGTRREGMFSAVQNWANKLAVSLALLFSGILLNYTGFDATIEGSQSATTLTTMRTLDAIVPAVFVGVACVLLVFYPLSKSKMHRLRRILEWRRARTSNA
jgi:GPH family glycoside/pentoside/hexuronide:cation symporter